MLQVHFRFRTNIKVGSLHMCMAFELLADSCHLLPAVLVDLLWRDSSLQQVLHTNI